MAVKTEKGTRYIQSIDSRWGNTRPYEWAFIPRERCEHVRRSAVTCQKSHVRLMRVPRVGVAASRLESRMYSTLYTRMAHAMSNGCSLQNTRSNVDRSSTLDMSLSTREAEICTYFMPRASSRRRCCFVNYKLLPLSLSSSFSFPLE